MDKKCKERIGGHLKSRIEDLEKLWEAEKQGNEERVEDLGTFNEYGLCFDYVAPGTFSRQTRGYFRYQLSWGGPSDEFRYFCDENFNITRIEYWFQDWFDGAKKVLGGARYNLMAEIFDCFKECETVKAVYGEALKS